ncbi:MAG: hypothetical protein PHR56_07500, partial [Dehalococcoidales bacterium]|nr:hypothetical protein [Dehalococcoidales bacterium]
NVEIRTGLKVIAITDSGVTAVDSNGKQVELAGDKVVLALGLTAQAGLYDELRDKVRETYLIGDAASPRRLEQAIREGYRAGAAL